MNTFTSHIAVVAAALADDAREAARLARPAGFAGLQFDAHSASLDIPGLSGSGRREFVHMLASHNRQLVGLRTDLGPRGLTVGVEIDAALDRLDGVMEAAASLAAPLVCLDLGPLPQAPAEQHARSAVTPEQAGAILLPPSLTAIPAPQVTSAPLPPVGNEAFAAQVDGALAELGRRADRYGVTLACRTELAGFASLAYVLHRAACPWLGVDLDPVAILRDEWHMDEVFSRLGAQVRHVRARDALKGAGRRTQPAIIGQGNVDWAKFLSDLDGAGYHGWITIDPIELTDRSNAAILGSQVLHRLRHT